VLICKHSGSTSGSYMLSITPANGNYSFTVINASSSRINCNCSGSSTVRWYWPSWEDGLLVSDFTFREYFHNSAGL
jgi:hypothetical protein